MKNLSLKISKSFLTNRTKALTLIELVFVIAIMGLLIHIASNNFIGLGNFKAQSQLHTMEDTLMNLRNQSIRNRKRSSFQVLSEGYFVYMDGELVLKDTFCENLSLEDRNLSDKNGDSFAFTEKGRPSMSGTMIFKIGQKKRVKLVLTPVTGKVYLREIDEKN